MNYFLLLFTLLVFPLWSAEPQVESYSLVDGTVVLELSWSDSEDFLVAPPDISGKEGDLSTETRVSGGKIHQKFQWKLSQTGKAVRALPELELNYQSQQTSHSLKIPAVELSSPLSESRMEIGTIMGVSGIVVLVFLLALWFKRKKAIEDSSVKEQPILLSSLLQKDYESVLRYFQSHWDELDSTEFSEAELNEELEKITYGGCRPDPLFRRKIEIMVRAIEIEKDNTIGQEEAILRDVLEGSE
jgi:hypothetical protein